MNFNIYTNRFLLFLICCIAAAFRAESQNPAAAPPQTKPVALTGATIHPVSGQPIPNGVIVFDKGIITAVGDSATPFDKAGTEIIHLPGKHVYPGAIAMASTVGLQEIAAVRATLDYQETGTLNPNARALVAYNTDSEIIPTLRSSGVLIVQATPQGGLLSGTSSVFHTDGWNWEDAVLMKDDGVWLNWPPYIASSFNFRDFSSALKRNEARQEHIDQLKRFFSDAKAYQALSDPQPVNLRLHAMKGVFEGKANLYIRAEQARDIVESVGFAHAYGIGGVVIVGGREAGKVTGFLKENDVAVVLNEVHRLPDHQDADVYQPYSLPGRLLEGGVRTALSYGNESWRVRNLSYQAGTAAGFSDFLSREEALRLVTLYPARILGIDQLVGSLETGKHATLIVTEGDMLDMKTNIVELAFIKGSRTDLDDKQKRLYRKYKEKYGQ
ncbi:MAG: amidohydrolase [Cytophagaceae bacterium SCN 52-12]|nr:MAG: amidohydrolase [Cytophagaceae bacterium SCN 52-12]